MILNNFNNFFHIDHAWLIRSPTKSFMLYAASEIEKREWINHINMCIKHELDKSKYIHIQIVKYF